MIESLRIANLRGIARLPLLLGRRINVVTGKRDCGKSTLLQAVALVCAGPSARAALSDIGVGASEVVLRVELTGRGEAVLTLATEGGIVRATLECEGATDPLLPATFFGAGIHDLPTFARAMAECRGGVVLLDDIEERVALTSDVWRELIGLARVHDVQLFAATGSADSLQSLLAAVGDDLDDLALHQLERIRTDRHRMTTRTDSQLTLALEDGTLP